MQLNDEIIRRIAERYKNCEVNIYPDFPECTPVEGVLRCAIEEGFVLTEPAAPAESQAVGPLDTPQSGQQHGYRVSTLVEALKRIRDEDDACQCECGEDRDCCVKVGVFCGHCIAENALAVAEGEAQAELVEKGQAVGEREHFEGWWQSWHLGFKPDDLKRTGKSGAYNNVLINDCWLTWQVARAALAQPSPGDRKGE
jgi:hypothetical protein